MPLERPDDDRHRVTGARAFACTAPTALVGVDDRTVHAVPLFELHGLVRTVFVAHGAVLALRPGEALVLQNLGIACFCSTVIGLSAPVGQTCEHFTQSWKQ